MIRKAKTLALALTAAAALAALAAAPASAAFGLKDLAVSFVEEDGTPATQAGAHPFALVTDIAVETEESDIGPIPADNLKELRIELPPGMVGNPTAVPPCSSADFARLENGGPSCSAASAVGVADVNIALGSNPPSVFEVAVYNIAAPPGAAAKIGFVTLNVPITAELNVNPNPPYNVVATLENVPQPARFYSSSVEIWSNPASPVHDADRGTCATNPVGTCPVSIPEKPFLTMPRSCSGPLTSRFEAVSWQNQGVRLAYPVLTPVGMSGCSDLGFAPQISSQATTGEASSPTGLAFNLDIDDPGLSDVDGIAKSDIKKALVTLPEGVTLNPGVAQGLEACTQADLARETAFSAPGAGCPQASKVGEVEVETPLLEGKVLNGSIYVAAQDENPFGSLLAIYMVIQDPELGISVKLPGRVEPHPVTGQLTTTFGEAPYEVPQFPFSHLRFRFRGGDRAPLITPERCGTYETKAVFAPWANPDDPYTATAEFEVTSGPGGSPCPSAEPFAPGFLAGSESNAAGRYSPFHIRLTRGPGEAELVRFDSVLPPGLTGKLAGVGRCSEEAIAAARQKSGREEIASPSCPASSRIGSSLSGAGGGSSLTYVPGSLYLAGPFGGAPLSVVAVTPAVAGPFDVGTVVVREALNVNPITARVEASGAASEPIPRILEGIPLQLRDLRLAIDRPEFMRNPTSCAEEQSLAALFGADVPAPVQLVSRFQAASCASLQFKPRLSIKLKGGTRRAAYPALEATVRPRPGDANIKKAIVTLPASAFLAQEHIVTVCTRVQFRADQCPKGSIYGFATARTPLLDEPLRGPVYLRSSNNPLPDLVADLKGLVDVELVGRIDSVKGAIRSNFEAVPDQPVSSFTLKMKGGGKGLITNSENLCARRSRAVARMTAQNGRAITLRPVVRAVGCGSKKKR